MEMCFLTSGCSIRLEVLVVFEEIHSHIVEQQLKRNENYIVCYICNLGNGKVTFYFKTTITQAKLS
jgi:hypothetical protein